MSSLSEDVRRFVLTSVPSVPYLEAALLFHASPGQTLEAADVARRLYLRERSADELLSSLCQAGVLAEDGERGYRYAPRDDALVASLDALARAYAGDLIAVTNLIHDATQKSAHRFADAFKLRKDR